MRVALVLASFLLVAPLGCGAHQGHRPAVFIDTDMSVDDAMALLYLLQRGDLDIEGIGVSGTGLAHLAPGTRNTLGLLALAGCSHIPVARGSTAPIEGDHPAHIPETFRVESDTLLGVDLPESDRGAVPAPAPDLLLSVLREAPGRVMLITLGPLTNVARALLRDPSAAERIERIYMMGGAVEVPGNLSDSDVDNLTAEWNIYLDPRAAAIVLASGVPITLVPLDATNQVPMTTAFYERIASRHTTPEATLVYELLDRLAAQGKLDGPFYFWDPLAAVIASGVDVGTTETRTLVIETEEGPESGRTRAHPAGRAVQVATGVDRAAFEEELLETLNRPTSGCRAAPRRNPRSATGRR